MRQLLPFPMDSVDTALVYADLPNVEHRPVVRLNMISSVDGATTVGAVSGGLGGPADMALFGILRSLADVVLVAAGTVRAEHYGPSDVPIAVVTRALDLDWDSTFFTEVRARPMIVTVEDAPAANLRRAAGVADVIIAGSGTVDFGRALAELASRGHRHVLAEGGPTLNGQLAHADVIDELCLTISPKLAAGPSKRIIAAPALPMTTPMALHSVLEDDAYLFLRYRRQARCEATT